jgi:multiple sugar transport system substrate-binding protein
MNKKQRLMWIVLLALSILIVACGGNEAVDTPAEEVDSGVVEEGASAETAPEPETDAAPEPVTIKLARFFGDCDDTTAGVTDVSQATSECEVIQILTNKFNAENESGITVERLGGAEWGTYYDALNATFAGGDRPDVAVMHGSNLPDYASRDLLLPLGEPLTSQGFDISDWTTPALGAVTYNDTIYGVPFDLHANLWHVNNDIFAEAGLVDADGNAVMPTSREEFMAQAAAIQALGYTYMATDASQFPIGVRIMFTLVWQQGSDLIAPTGNAASVDTAEAAEALDFMLEMFDKGYADPNANYDASQSAFLNGEAAVLHNGTWAVDQYNREATFNYSATNFPTLYSEPATWANSHMWTVPQQNDTAKYDAAVEFVAWLGEHTGDWATGTGHLAPRRSVLASESYNSAPQRSGYADTANIARLVPAILNWQATEDILKEELESTWLTGKEPAQALRDANDRINDELGANPEQAAEAVAVADDTPMAEPVTIKLARFFGDCDDTTEGVTDPALATSECEVVQILTNKFNAENGMGITVERLGGAEWGTYYDALNATFAGGDRPDVAVMHGSNLPDYASRNLLLPLGDMLTDTGFDMADWTAPAAGAVTYADTVYGVPFDLHANLFHVNKDIMAEAGFVDDAGNVILPSSREEFMAQAQAVTDLGYTYLATDASQFPIGVRIMFTLVWQQGSDLISADGTSANANSAEAAEALDFMLEMFDKGYADPNANYDASQSAFLNGEAAILHNGTWAVDQYNREAEFDYVVLNFPTLYDEPATWANSHLWTIPAQPDEDNAKYDAALAFVTFLGDHTGDWATGTGHLAPRSSVLNSASYNVAPQRSGYANTANIARLVPAILNWQATEDILKEELESTWLTGKDAEQALNDANDRINDELSR